MKAAFALDDEAADAPRLAARRRVMAVGGAGAALAAGLGLFFATHGSTYEINPPKFITTAPAEAAADFGPSLSAHPSSHGRADTDDGALALRGGRDTGRLVPVAWRQDGPTEPDATLASPPAPSETPMVLESPASVQIADESRTSESVGTPGVGFGGSGGLLGLGGMGAIAGLASPAPALGAGGGDASQSAPATIGINLLGDPGADSEGPIVAPASDDPLAGLQPPQAVTTIAAGVPEPATWASLIVGFGLMGAMLRRRRAAA